MKKPKLKTPKLIKNGMKRIPLIRGRKVMGTEEQDASVPRITNDTVAAHREEVLGSARKYIYPLQHSRGRIVKISSVLLSAAIVFFFVYCGFALYKLQSTSSFLYEVTSVIPFPIAKAGSQYVAYENYLFELRHYVHYYQTQQKVDPSSTSGKQQISQYKKRALQQVIDDAYVKQLAQKNNISVSNQEVNNQITLVKSQNRLGNSDQMLGDVLKQFWGWSIDDFKRELKTQLLAQKVVSQLDVTTHARADNVLAQLKSGADFAKVAGDTSDDIATKAAGGQYGFAISRANRDVPPQVVDVLFKLQPGQVSDIIDTGYTLEIVKVGQIIDDKVQASHISFRLQLLKTYLDPLKAEHKTHQFIHL